MPRAMKGTFAYLCAKTNEVKRERLSGTPTQPCVRHYTLDGEGYLYHHSHGGLVGLLIEFDGRGIKYVKGSSHAV